VGGILSKTTKRNGCMITVKKINKIGIIKPCIRI
jgi:hypothetical protein